MVGLALDYYICVGARTGLRILLNNGEDVDSTGQEALGNMLEVGDNYNGLDVKGQASLPHRGLCQWHKACCVVDAA